MSLPADYRERVYAGWLGKCAGVRLGAPVENWTYKDIQNHLGSITGFLPLPPGKIFKPDDDIAGPLVYIRALEDFGPGVTAEQMGQTVLNYLGDQHGTFWWGGYGNSTEHTGYLNLAAGIPAPHSGSIALNGATVAEQIGGQIFSDVWGLVAPNNPALASEYARKASSVTHDGNAVYGGQFIAALTSLAFSEKDPLRLIEGGLALLPPGCEFVRVNQAVVDFWKAHPENWHACYKFIFENFGYDRYPGVVHIIPNAGIIAMALLYSRGDFSSAIQIATEGGWDTDCNAGNVGAIMGVAVGLEGIEPRWREPMNDVLVNASNIGSRNLIDIPACADLFVALGRWIAGLPVEKARARYHFDYPGATQGFLGAGERVSVVDIRNQPAPEKDGYGLRFSVRKLEKKGNLRLFVKTYYAPADLSANFYGASFSPKIYPGQTITAQIYLPPDSPTGLLGALYASGTKGELYQAVGSALTPGEWNALSFTLPGGESVYFAEVGAVIRHEIDAGWTGSVWLDDLDWSGKPDVDFDFKKAKAEYGAISQWTYLRGYWRLQDGAYHGSGPGVNETYSGDITWKDITLKVGVKPLLGEHHLIAVRVQGALRSYAFGLAPDGQVTLYKNDGGYKAVASAPFPWKLGEDYTLQLVCKGSQIIASANQKTLIEWSDSDKTYRNGQIGLVNFAGCHTRYLSVHVS